MDRNGAVAAIARFKGRLGGWIVDSSVSTGIPRVSKHVEKEGPESVYVQEAESYLDVVLDCETVPCAPLPSDVA